MHGRLWAGAVLPVKPAREIDAIRASSAHRAGQQRYRQGGNTCAPPHPPSEGPQQNAGHEKFYFCRHTEQNGTALTLHDMSTISDCAVTVDIRWVYGPRVEAIQSCRPTSVLHAQAAGTLSGLVNRRVEHPHLTKRRCAHHSSQPVSQSLSLSRGHESPCSLAPHQHATTKARTMGWDEGRERRGCCTRACKRC